MLHCLSIICLEIIRLTTTDRPDESGMSDCLFSLLFTPARHELRRFDGLVRQQPGGGLERRGVLEETAQQTLDGGRPGSRHVQPLPRVLGQLVQ